MKKTLLSILIITFMYSSKAQNVDTLYLCNGDRLSDNTKYDYYYTISRDSINLDLYVVCQFYKSGNIKQQCSYVSKKDIITKQNFIRLKNSKRISLIGRDITYYDSGKKMIERFHESKKIQSTNTFYLENGDSALLYTEKMPAFPGGMEALLRYVDDHFKYPVQAADANMIGTVIVLFVIDKHGLVQNVMVPEPLDPFLDDEAIRIVRLLPEWIPGTHNGMPQNVVMTIPVRYKKIKNAT